MCIYVYIYVCVFVSTHIYTYIHMYTRTHTHTPTHIIHICTYTNIYICAATALTPAHILCCLRYLTKGAPAHTGCADA